MRFQRRHRDRVAPLEIAPMIDVVFLLVIFFMTTAQFAQRSRADVSLQREPGERVEAAQQAQVIVNLLQGGEVVVGETAVAMSEFESMILERLASLEQRYGRADVLVRADRNADSADLNELVRALQRAGVSMARVATEVP